MIALIVVFSIIALLAVLILIPLYFDIRYTYNKKTGNAQIIFKYLCFKTTLFPRKKKAKKDKKDSKKEKKKSTINDFKKNVDNFFLLWDDICNVIYILFKKATYVKYVSIRSDFGFDDPMITGMATGIANAMIYNLLSVIEQCSNLDNREIILKPDFDKPCFSLDFNCIIKIRTVHIIVIAIKLLKMFFKIN